MFPSTCGSPSTPIISGSITPSAAASCFSPLNPSFPVTKYSWLSCSKRKKQDVCPLLNGCSRTRELFREVSATPASSGGCSERKRPAVKPLSMTAVSSTPVKTVFSSSTVSKSIFSFSPSGTRSSTVSPIKIRPIDAFSGESSSYRESLSCRVAKKPVSEVEPFFTGFADTKFLTSLPEKTPGCKSCGIVLSPPFILFYCICSPPAGQFFQQAGGPPHYQARLSR